MRGKLSENLFLFVLAPFVFMSLFGVGVGMELENGQISSCPFMAGEASLCQMGVAEHIGQWQRAFLGIPIQTSLLLLAFLLLSVIVIPFAKPFTQIKQTERVVRLASYRKAAVVNIFDQLLFAFSDGILNPKIYGSKAL